MNAVREKLSVEDARQRWSLKKDWLHVRPSTPWHIEIRCEISSTCYLQAKKITMKLLEAMIELNGGTPTKEMEKMVKDCTSLIELIEGDDFTLQKAIDFINSVDEKSVLFKHLPVDYSNERLLQTALQTARSRQPRPPRPARRPTENRRPSGDRQDHRAQEECDCEAGRDSSRDSQGPKAACSPQGRVSAAVSDRRA